MVADERGSAGACRSVKGVCRKGDILVEGCLGGGGDLQIDCFADTVYIPYR